MTGVLPESLEALGYVWAAYVTEDGVLYVQGTKRGDDGRWSPAPDLNRVMSEANAAGWKITDWFYAWVEVPDGPVRLVWRRP